MNFGLVAKLPVKQFKDFIKTKFKALAFEHLIKLKESHSKVKRVIYSELRTQEYLVNNMFSNKDAEMLFNLRTKTDKNFKANFPSLNRGSLCCPLLCWTAQEAASLDTPEHLFECPKLKMTVNQNGSDYAKLFGNAQSQKEILENFKRLITYRESKITEKLLPEKPLDPSTVQDLCCDITVSTNYVSNVLSCGTNK